MSIYIIGSIVAIAVLVLGTLAILGPQSRLGLKVLFFTVLFRILMMPDGSFNYKQYRR